MSSAEKRGLAILSRTTMDAAPISKEEYDRIVKDRRSEFVYKNFAPQLAALFKTLREDAEQSRVCHRQLTVNIPFCFNAESIEAVLCSYFSDLGYKTLTETQTGEKDKITITIT